MSQTNTFFDECDARLSINKDPHFLSFFQIIRLSPKSRRSKQPRFGSDIDLLKNKFSDIKKQLKKTPGNFPENQEHYREIIAYYMSRPFYGRGTPRSQGFLPPWLCPLEFGLYLTFNQVWKPMGYSRGELINSICLAPGEEKNIEIFTWDRRKLEDERNFEHSHETLQTGTITGRTSLDTILSTRFKLGAGSEVGGEASVNLKELQIPADIGGNADLKLDTEFELSTEETRKQVIEATRSATNTLRATRKTRVVETMETGSENRITRKIVNTNRCHTLSFDYFEILEHYEVGFELKRIEEVVLIPLVPIDSDAINADWLLCHEFALRPHLPDPVFLEGFEAAKQIKAAGVFQGHAARQLLASSSIGDRIDSGSEAAGNIRAVLKPYVDQIIRCNKKLRQADLDYFYRTVGRLYDLNFLDSPTEDQWTRATTEAGWVLFEKKLLLLDSGFNHKVDDLENSCRPQDSSCLEPLRMFMDSIARTWTTLYSLGGMLEISGIDIVFNDAGLKDAVQSAAEALKRVELQTPLPQISVDQVPEINESANPVTVEDKIDDAFSFRELSLAQVEMERLVCHIKSNLDRYTGVIFAAEGMSRWVELVDRYPQIRNFVSPHLLGVQQGFSVFPLLPEFQRKLVSKNEDLIKNVIDAENKVEEVIVPTQGMVLESRLGQCSACEEFIREHRKLDLKMKKTEVREQKAKSAMADLEAARYQARLAADPPVLDDPADRGSDLTVSLNRTSDDGGGE